jgi:hypothetical protein
MDRGLSLLAGCVGMFVMVQLLKDQAGSVFQALMLRLRVLKLAPTRYNGFPERFPHGPILHTSLNGHSTISLWVYIQQEPPGFQNLTALC